MDEISKQDSCISRILKLRKRVKSLEEQVELSALRDIHWASWDFLIFPEAIYPFDVSLDFMKI